MISSTKCISISVLFSSSGAQFFIFKCNDLVSTQSTYSAVYYMARPAVWGTCCV